MDGKANSLDDEERSDFIEQVGVRRTVAHRQGVAAAMKG